MGELLAYPGMAPALLVLGALLLAWGALGAWARVRPVGDDLGAALDALAPRYDFSDLPEAEGPPPGTLPVPLLPDLFDALCRELGFQPGVSS